MYIILCMYLCILLTCTYSILCVYLDGIEIILFVCFVVSVVCPSTASLPSGHCGKYLCPLFLAF